MSNNYIWKQAVTEKDQNYSECENGMNLAPQEEKEVMTISSIFKKFWA